MNNLLSSIFPLNSSTSVATSVAAAQQGRVGFDAIKNFILFRPTGNMLINTLPETSQQCLILNTTPIQDEIAGINRCLEEENYNIAIYIYGMNNRDPSVERKQQQLRKMGFRNVYVYLGGLFEWALLQDVYGEKEFPTTTPKSDPLDYK